MCALLTMLCAATAASPLRVQAEQDDGTHVLQRVARQDVSGIAGVLQDDLGILDFDEVRTRPASDFSPLERANLGVGVAVHWIRLHLRNGSEESMQRFLNLPQSAQLVSARVVVSEPSSGQMLRELVWGPDIPFAERPVESVNIVFPMTIPAGSERTVLMRLDPGGGKLYVAPEVLDPATFLKQAQRQQALAWGFYGLLIVMAIYNTVLFVTLRDVNYVSYGGCLVLALLFDMCGEGLAGQYLWPGQPGLSAWAFPGVGLGMLAFQLYFTLGVLDVPGHAPRIARLIRWVTCLLLALSLVSFLVEPRVGKALFVVGAALDIPICLLSGLLVSLAGYRPARIYLLAWGAFFACVSVQAMQNVGVLPAETVPDSLMPRLGVAFQVIIFGLILAQRYALLRDQVRVTQQALVHSQEERLVAQAEALRLKEQAAGNLSREVDERTEQLRQRTEEAEQAKHDAEDARNLAELAHVQMCELDHQKTTFFQNISHELRTPLTLILNPLEQEARDRPDNDNVVVAERNARRLLRLVNQLLGFQKLASGKGSLQLRPVDLVRFIHGCCSYFAPYCKEQRVFLALSFDGQPLGQSQLGEQTCWVQAEVDALEKIAFNYLSNALKHTPRGGRIELALQGADGRARMCVIDTGPGVPEEEQESIFELFSQVRTGEYSKAESTGIGLAFVKQLAQAMEGVVGVTSEGGRGSTFWLDLPTLSEGSFDQSEADSERSESLQSWLMADRYAQEEVDSTAVFSVPPEGAAASSTAGPGELVLVVDDLRDMRRLVRSVLTDAGYRVVEASEGEQALQMAETLQPDLLVTDWMMPGLSGVEVIASMRARSTLCNIPTILLTARSDEDSRLLGAMEGADAFLGKPFSDQELLAIVRNLMSLKHQERELKALNGKLAEQGLMRCLPPAVVEGVLAGELELEQEPRSLSATLLVVSLVGFDERTRKLQVLRSARMLNEYLVALSEVVFRRGGMVVRIDGDEVVALFGAPAPLGQQDQAICAGLAAQEIAQALDQLASKWSEAGEPDLVPRMGLHAGTLVLGTFGGARRAEYTVIGPTVSGARRLHREAPAGAIYLSRQIADLLPEEVAEDVGRWQSSPGLDAEPIYRMRAECLAVLEGRHGAA